VVKLIKINFVIQISFLKKAAYRLRLFFMIIHGIISEKIVH
jgi:hypothetical protein